MAKLSLEEFLEKYGEVRVKFSHYYKFCFHFEGEVEGTKVVVSVGGDSGSIYKEHIVAGRFYSVAELDPYYGVVTDTEGQIVDEFLNAW
jgi:hypothetical protein